MFNPLFPLDNLAGQLMTKCPICKSKKDFLEVTFIEDQEDGHLVYIKCKKCFTKLVGIINFSSMGTSVVSFMTDLNRNEVQKFRKGERVNEDDVLELHQILENKKLNFLQIIN